MKSARSVKLVCMAGLLAVAALVVFCAFQLPQLNTRYSVRQFFPKDHAALKADDEVKRVFQLRSAPSFFVALDLREGDAGGWLEPKRLADLRKITARLAALPDVKSALSLGNVEMAVNKRRELRIGTLADTMPAKQWEPFVSAQPLLSPQLVSADRRSVLLVVEPSTSSSTSLKKLEDRIRGVLAKNAAAYETGIGGVPAVQSRLSTQLQTEVGRFFGLCLLIFSLMFALFYRNFAPVLFAGVGLIVCNIVVVGVISLLGLPFTVLLSTLPIIASIAFVSLAIHTLHLWADRLTEAGSPTNIIFRWRLSLRVLREIALANFLGSLTTAIGFVALASAPIPAIRDYGLIIAASIMGVFVLTQFAMTFALPWFTPVQRDWTRSRAWWTVKILRWSAPIFVGVIGVSVFFGGAVVKLNFSAKLFDDLPAKEAVAHAMARIDRQFGGTVALDINIDAGHGEAWSDPAGLRVLRATLAEIRKVPGVGAALGLTDFFDEKLPKSKAAVSEIYFLFSMAAQDPLQQFVDPAGRRTRISVRLGDLPSHRVDEVRAVIHGLVSKNFPQGKIGETGMAVNSHTINREVAQQLVFGFWHSLVLIGVLLAIVFRSVRWALVACLPNLVPPAVLIGALAFFQTPVKPSIALIFSIALGLAFNNTVYLLTRMHRLRADKKMRTLPLRRTLLEEGNPCLSESLLTFAGFLIFLSSDFQLNQTFGAYMVLSIVAGAVGDLVFLPALLKQFPEVMGRLRQVKSKAELPAAKVRKLEDRKTDEKKSFPPPAAAAALAGLLIGAGALVPRTAQADEASALLSTARQSIESRSDQATVTLKIIEANGEQKIRKMKLRTLREDGSFHALVRIESPANIKGTALLAEIKDGTQNQWLYLPSSRQVRRVVSAKSSTGVLGSELNPEDLSAAALKGSSSKLLKKDAKTAQIEILPTKGTSAYSRAVLTLSLPKALPLKLEYQRKGKTVKTVEFADYVSPDGKVHRARRIIVRNKANRRGTDVEFADLKVNAPLKASDFSVNALKKGN